MRPAALTVWLDGLSLAVIEERRGRLRMTYTDEALEAFPPGAPVLSLSLPLAPEPHSHGAVRPFLEGLLPEGEARRQIAIDVHATEDDTYGLIAALGRDCAGALIVQPSDDPPPPRATTRTAERLSQTALGDLVANLRAAPLGVGGRVRVSLAGIQEKLLLTRLPDGSWGRPVDGTPSTHILKPESTSFADTVVNEAFCMRLARHLGLPAASIETQTVGGRRVIVVERYDRVVAADGAVERIHQEDLCQATGTLPTRKYQEDGGPSLLDLARLLETAASPGALRQLLSAVTLNVAVGNGDAHAKNFSLMHHRDGGIGLAPLYDVMSTLVYGDDRLAMYVDDVRRTERVTTERLVNEAARWGLPHPSAFDVINDLLDRVPEAVVQARDETPDLPDAVLAAVESQFAALTDQGRAGRRGRRR